MAVETAQSGTTCSRARSSRTLRRWPRPRRATAPLPRTLHPQLARRFRSPSSTRTSAEAWDAAARGRARRSSRRARRRGKSLAFNLPVLDAIAREPKTRALYLYPTKALAQDQARALGGLKAPNVRAGDLRRRHAERAPLADPEVGERDPDQPGHAPRRRAAAPRPLGGRAPQPPLRRRRRGARLPRRLRLPRRQRPAAAAAARARLRRRPAVPARHRRRSRTRASSRRRCSAVDASVVDLDAAPRAERTIALWNPELLDAELGLRASALGEASRLLAGLVVPRAPDDLLREEPQGRRADPPLHRPARRRRDREAARALPRRLHACTAPRDRAATRRGRAARRLRDRRARARDRHRPARLRDLRRLPRDGRVAPAAVGPRRPPRARPRRPRRKRGRARPVLHARAGDAARPPRRGRDPRPREPARPRRPRPRRRVRGAGRRRRPRDARRRGAGARRRSSPTPAHEGRLRLGGTRLPGGAGAAALASPDSFTVVDARDRAVLGLVERERAYSTVHEGAVYLHLGESYLVRELDLTRGRPS